MKNGQTLPAINNLLSEEEMERISIEPTISRYAFDGEYVSIAQQLRDESYNQSALNHLRSII